MFEWIQQLADWLVFDIFNLKEGNHLAEALHFFIYDSIIFFRGLIIGKKTALFQLNF